jgi:hypothetical protein
VLVQGEVGGGFRLLEHGFALLTEDEIFGQKSHKRRKSARPDDDPRAPSSRASASWSPATSSCTPITASASTWA